MEKKLINLQTQLKSLALIPITPMRTSSLKHTSTVSLDLQPHTRPRTPSRSINSSKENFGTINRSRSASPRKPLQQIPASNIQQPSDLVRSDDTEEFIEHSKRLFTTLHTENTNLKAKIRNLENSNKNIDSLQSELESLTRKNHELEKQLQSSRAGNHQHLTSPIPSVASRRRSGEMSEVERLSEELEWHAKLHLYAEKERLRLLDLLEFAGREGKIVGREYVGLKQKMSMISLRSQGSDCKCLV